MGAADYQRLAEEKDAQALVRGVMELLTADLRELALRALAEWQQVGIATPALLPSLAAMQRPDAGTWNGLLLVLLEARLKGMVNPDARGAERIAQAKWLAAIAEWWTRALPVPWDAALRALAGGADVAATFGRCVQGAILLSARAEMAADKAGWDAVAKDLRPLAAYMASDPLRAIRVLPQSGRTLEPGAISAVELAPAFSALLGKEHVPERDLRALLERHAPAHAPGILLGDFVLTAPVGDGGFGTVYAARQVSTGRKVAVKVLHDGMPAEMQARFAREAEYLARFSHPHIVGVLAYGRARWTAPADAALEQEAWFEAFRRSAPEKSYIAMEWVEGRTLDAVYRAAKADPTARRNVRTIVQWFAQAAQALQAVHAAGLVHRDVKPSNLMLTDQDGIKLMDFGIARVQVDERTLITTTGRVFGTLVYMSPEQIRATQAESEIGPATDIYSLCATFYELFTLTRLYEHDTQSAEIVKTRKLAGQRPSPPRARVRDLPWEVEVIVLGGLETELADRYRTMESLARDLQHLLRDEPIEYRRPALARRAQLTYRRHRAVARVVAAGVLVAAIAAVVSVNALRQAAQREREAQALSLEERGRQELLAGQYVPAANHLSQAYSMGKSDPALRFLLASALRELPAPAAPSLGHTKGVYTAEYNRDCSRVATAGRDGTIRIWDVKTGTCLKLELDPAHEVSGAMFNPAGDRVVASDDGGNAAVWDANTGQRVYTFPRQSKVIYTPRFSPTGTRILMACGDGFARVYDAATGNLLKELPAKGPVICAFFNRDESRILMGSEDRSAYLWDGQSYALVAQLAATEKITRAEFSLDGSKIVVSSLDPFAAVKFYDGVTGNLLHLDLLGPNTLARRVTFSPDGSKLVVSNRDGISYWWDLQVSQYVPLEHDQGVFSAAFSHDGTLFGTAGRNGKVKLWDAATGNFVRELSGHAGPVYQLVFSQDSKQILTAGEDGTARIWDTKTGVVLQNLDGHPAPIAPAPLYAQKFLETAPADASPLLVRPLLESSPVVHATFTPDSQRVLLTDEIPIVRSVVNGERGAMIASMTGRAVAACLRKDGAVMAVVDQNAGVAFLTLTGDARNAGGYNQVELHAITPAGTALTASAASPKSPSLLCVAYSPDGARLVVGGSSGAWILDATTLRTICTLPQGPGRADVLHAEFAPDSRHVVTAGTDGSAKLWDLSTTPATSRTLHHKADVNWATFSPDGTLVLTASNDGDAALWDAASGARRHTLNQGNKDFVMMAAFSPDGSRVVTADRDYTARVYDVTSGNLVATMQGHANKVTSANFSPDGALLVTSSEDGKAMIWEAATGKLLAVLNGHQADVRWAEFSPDGIRVVTASDDLHAFIWDTHLESRSAAQVARLLH